MTIDSIKHPWRRLAALVLGGTLALTLVACGGGGGSPGTVGGNTSGTIAIALTDTSGVASNTLSGSETLTVVATVKNGAGSVAKNEVVTFSVSNNLATISPTSATALTDSNGVARVSLKSAGNGTGAATVTATAKVTGASASVSGSMNFAVGASATATPVAVNFISAVPSDKSIVIKGAGGNGRTEVALLTFQVVDNTNAGIPGVTLNFTTQSSAAVTLVSTSGTTDSDGKAAVSLNSGALPTTVRVIATVAGTSISTLSDTVTVTTGQPVQQAFSLSMETHNPEGWNIDNTQVSVLALMADANGQAVADGTQVVFTTDAGAIFGSGGAKCLTVNGACSVTWRSQNPRPASGIGTITATATSGSANLSASQSFYMSGSNGNVHYPAGGAAVPSIAATFSCAAPTSMPIRVTDVNNNPMPKGTTISAENATGVSVAVTPSTVVDLAPLSSGSSHNLVVTPPSPCVAGATGLFYIGVAAPSGRKTLTPVTISTEFSPDSPAPARQTASERVTIPPMCQNIFLVGLMGAGKTTVGRALSKRLGLRFIDSDQEIEARTGATIPLIFEIEGEESFRRREAEVIRDLTAEKGIVLATGGGAILDPESRNYLKTRGTVIYLRASINSILHRTGSDRNRPLLQTDDPRKKLEELAKQRDPLYSEVASLVIDTGRPNVHSVLQVILAQLDAKKSKGDVGRAHLPKKNLNQEIA